MTFTNGDAYRAINNQLVGIAEEVKHYATLYTEGKYTQGQFMEAVAICMKRFASMREFQREVSEMFESIEQYI